MLTHDEIVEIVDDLLGSLRRNSSISNAIRNLQQARGELDRSPDNSGELSLAVIDLRARVHRAFVRNTDLRQEEELETAIKLATDSINRGDYLESVDYEENYASGSD